MEQLLNRQTGKFESLEIYKKGNIFAMPLTYQGEEILNWQVYDMSEDPPKYCLATDVVSRTEAIDYVDQFASEQPVITPETPAEFLERELKSAQEASGVGFEYTLKTATGNKYAVIEIDDNPYLGRVYLHLYEYDHHAVVYLHGNDCQATWQNARTQAVLLTIAADIAERWEARQQENEA